MSEENGLIARAQQGDAEALAEIVESHQRTVYNVALRMCGNPHDAEETLQETFLSAIKALPSFEGRAQFSTWLYRITVNHSKNRIGYLARRAHYRRDELMEYTQGDESISLIPRTERPDERVGDREMMAHLMDRLSSLKKKDREIIVLKDRG